MPPNFVDLFQLQLAQQAMLYDLAHMSDRKQSAERVANFFVRMQKLLPVTTVLEIGAHEATFSRAVKKACPEKIVRAFEANPQVYAHFLLEGEFRTLGIDYRYGAIGNSNGSTRLNIYETIDGKEEPCDSRRQSILLRVPNDTDRHYTVWVPLARLDTLCAKDPEDSRYALWIDAEGAGGQVLEGADGILDKILAVYIELESEPKFENQPLDRDIMHYLLERDFVPLLRDFQFNHQYNVVFVKKAALPLVEHEWHRYFNYALRQSLKESFKLEVAPKQPVPVAPPPLPRLRFGNVAELREAINELPLLRAPRTGIDPSQTVVACHESDLDEAINFYRQQCARLPEFYVLGDSQEHYLPLHDFSELKQGMDIQLYFRLSPRPGAGPYPTLVHNLQKMGIYQYCFEQYSAKNFWNKKPILLSEKDWDTILSFVNTLSDADSQYTYMAVCRSRLEAEPGYVPLAGFKQYAHPLVHAEPGDIVCEGGCHTPHINMSSTLLLHHAMQGRGSIFGFEPVPDTYENLQKMYRGFPNIKMIPQALWSVPGSLELVGGGTSAHTQAVDQNSGNCSCTSIDTYFSDKSTPTLIKLDVEGAEPHVLKGAEQTIRNHLPKLMLSLYHGRHEPDWVTIPEMLLEMNLPYSYHCAHHQPWYNETVLYAKKSEDTDVC